MIEHRALPLVVATAVIGLTSTGAANAGRNDLRLVNLCPQTPTPGLGPGVNGCHWVKRNADGMITGVAIDAEGRSKYRSLMSELGVVLAPRIPTPANTIGFAGFLLSMELGLTQINRNKGYWDGVNAVSPQSAAASRPDATLTTAGVFLRKGLWFPIPSLEVGGGVVNLLDSQMLSWQLYATFALHEGFYDLPFPSLAMRMATSYVTGTDQVNMTTTTFDAVLSKGFGVLKTTRLEPFGGLGLLLIKANGRLIDLTPLCDAHEVAEATPGQETGDRCAVAQSGTGNDLLANAAFPTQDTITRYRVFGGAKLKFGMLVVIAQYELFLAGHSRDAGHGPDEGSVPAVDQSGRQSAFTLSTGLGF